MVPETAYFEPAQVRVYSTVPLTGSVVFG